MPVHSSRSTIRCLRDFRRIGRLSSLRRLCGGRHSVVSTGLGLAGLLISLGSMDPDPIKAQAFNIDFGSEGSKPAASYGAAGLPGVWNAVGELPASTRTPLVGLDGAPTGVELYQIGADLILVENDPATTGDHEALLDEMYLSFNDPIDGCFWIDHLDNGVYEVLTYALTPSDPGLLSRIRVDFSPEPPVLVGGAWTGAHAENISYARHTVTVTAGRIGLHSGLPSGFIQSGANGIQIRPLTAAGVGDAAPLHIDYGIVGAFPNPAGALQTLRLRLPADLANRAGAGLSADPTIPRLLAIFDVSGRLIWSTSLEGLPAGEHEIRWDGRDLRGRLVPGSVYFARLPWLRGPAGSLAVIRLD